MPYFFVGDDAFALNIHMLKPYNKLNLSIEERVFNYRLSRARRIVENAFGILASKWRIFRKPIICKVETVEYIVGACVCLHNWLREQDLTFIDLGLVDSENTNKTVNPGSWRQQESTFLPINARQYNSSRQAKQMRDSLAKYLTNEGAVPWQWDLL